MYSDIDKDGNDYDISSIRHFKLFFSLSKRQVSKNTEDPVYPFSTSFNIQFRNNWSYYSHYASTRALKHSTTNAREKAYNICMKQ